LLPRRIGQSRKKPDIESVKIAVELREQFMREKWGKLLDYVREGARITEAVAEVGIDRDYLTKILRTSKEARAQWDEAKLNALWKGWDIETMEDVLVEIAMGSTVKNALDGRGLKYEGFYALVMRDSIVKEMYDEAQKIRMEGMADDILEISDNGETDRDAGTGRVNHEVVARDKLRTDNRKWLMARLHYKRFGDRLQTEQEIKLVVDHASRLTAARKRKEKLIQGRASVAPAGAEAIEGELVTPGETADEPANA
jgi:hypothetical protein